MSATIFYPKDKETRWVIFDRVHDYSVGDRLGHTNLFFIASSGQGTHRDDLELAKKVVDFLNSLP